MFKNLYKLYRNNNSLRTPLEDFNTECFAGILKMHPEILMSFVTWLKLPHGNYSVNTQSHYRLDETHSFVDMVLESDHTICFIENKVNSTEGREQLDNYSRILDRVGIKNTYLIYCTKNIDLKKRKDHNFHQFRWWELARWIENSHQNIALVSNYINFLKQQQMAHDTSISTDSVITLKHFLNTYDTMDFHMDNALPSFKNYFPDANIGKQDSLSLIREHNRIAKYVYNPLLNSSYHSEILYGILFGSVTLQTHIWVHKSHPQSSEISRRGKESGLFISSEIDEYGTVLLNSKPLYEFIERKDSDREIKEWFEKCFSKIRKFIDDNPDLNWDHKVLR